MDVGYCSHTENEKYGKEDGQPVLK